MPKYFSIQKSFLTKLTEKFHDKIDRIGVKPKYFLSFLSQKVSQYNFLKKLTEKAIICIQKSFLTKLTEQAKSRNTFYHFYHKKFDNIIF